MNQFQFFIKCLYNRKAIAFSRFQPVTKAIFHVITLVFIACLPFIITMSLTYITSISQLEESLSNELPAFSLENGQLEADLEQPYINQSTTHGAFVLDPRNQMELDDLSHLGEGVIFQQSEAILFRYGSTHHVSYTLIGLEQVDRDELTDRLGDIRGFLPLLLVIVSLLLYSGLLGAAFLGVTVLAGVSLLLRGSRKNLQYRHLWLITSYAMTLPVILFAWVDVVIGSISPIFMVIATLVIIYVAIQTIPIPKHKPSEQP